MLRFICGLRGVSFCSIKMTDKGKIVGQDVVNASRIFTGYRALGLVSNHIPLITRYIAKRKETLICTVIGNSFHTYRVTFKSFSTFILFYPCLLFNFLIDFSQGNLVSSKLEEPMKMTLPALLAIHFMSSLQVEQQSEPGREQQSSKEHTQAMKNQST